MGEWGDKSQITTISLTAIYNPIYVFMGAIIAHLICTIIAVHGGKLIANKLSEKNFNFLGGITFFCIALLNTYMAIFLWLFICYFYRFLCFKSFYNSIYIYLNL